MTDPYQPLERTVRRTRAVLELMAECRHPVAIVTKGALVTRDADLLGPLAAKGLAHVCASVTTLDAGLARRLAPIRALAGAGVPVGFMMGPVIPVLIDHEVEAVLAACAEAGATSAHSIMLRLPSEVAGLWEDWPGTHAPDREARVLARQRALHGGRLNDPPFGARMRGEGPHCDLICRRFEVARRRLGLSDSRPRLRADQFHPPARDPRRGRLF